MVLKLKRKVISEISFDAMTFHLYRFLLTWQHWKSEDMALKEFVFGPCSFV
jgi:hypothetical protein